MSIQPKKTMTWLLVFSFLTVFSWGFYGLLLFWGTRGMSDPIMGRYKAFLFVGFAYFLVAIIAPLIFLRLYGKPGDTNFLSYPALGWKWSLLAGTVGAIGAFGLLLAFGSAPGATPAARAAYVPVVMCIVFGAAPIVNAFATMAFPDKGVSGFEIKPQFWIGIILAAVGGCFVALYKPEPAGGHGPAPTPAGQTAPAHAAGTATPAATEPAAKH